MSFVRRYLPDDLPHLTNYTAAALWHDAVKPFAKGKNVGEKPLGLNRRYHRLLISKGAEGQVIVKHYSTNILTYYTDNSIELNSSYMDSISTCQAMQELLGADKFARRQGKIYFKDKNGHFFRIAKGLRVGADGVAVNPESEQVYELNRARFKDLKAKYKMFTDYTKQIVALTHGGKERDTYLAGAVRDDGNARIYGRYGDWALRTDAYGVRWYSSAQPKLRKTFFDAIEATLQIEDEAARIEAMYPLTQYLSFCSAVDWKVNRARTDLGREECDYVWETNTKRIDKFFGDLLKYQYPAMCFDSVYAEYGKIHHNPNKKFIKTT